MHVSHPPRHVCHVHYAGQMLHVAVSTTQLQLASCVITVCTQDVDGGCIFIYTTLKYC